MRQVTQQQMPLQSAITDFIRVLEKHYGPFLPIQRTIMARSLMTIAEAGMKQERERMRELAKDENCEAMFMTGCPFFPHLNTVHGIAVVKETP